MRAVTIGQNEAGQRLDKFLNKYMKEAGVSFFYKMMRKKNIVLNGKKCTGKEILLIGDEVKLFLAEETLEKFGAPPADYSAQKKAAGTETKEYLLAFEKLKNIRILYEDEDILALDKPAGVLSQKASVTDFSANEWLIGYLLSQKKLTAEALATFHPSVCNRLDRNTSGLLLCGKSLLGTQKLTGLIRNRQIHKYFNTACGGRGRNQNGDRTPRLPGAFRHRDGHLCTGRVVYRQDAPDPRTFCMGRASLTGRPEIRKRSSQSNPEANLRNRQTAVACMADPPEGRCLWHFTDRRHHLSAAGGFSEAAFGGRNTALNHIKKECALAHSRAEARLLRQPSTPAPSAHPRGAFLSYGNEVSYTRTKSLAAAVDCTQPYRRLFIL